MSDLTLTEQLMGAMLDRLKEAFGTQLMVELFPENPSGYRLNHPRGAILIAYGNSTFGASESTDAVFQARNIKIRLSLVFRQLHGRDGAIHYMDQIRTCLTGWYAPHCDQACRPVSEQFIGQSNLLWQYAQDYSMRTNQLQVMVPIEGARLRNLKFEEIE
ncbi:hypothetical protein ALP29_00224 [Pseudomonas syringae pv. avii]|uniref:Gp37 protein n=1 Tax=Pseudomonas syringae pv. avii TaxID=663959 RepID=A0A3M5VHR7_PSESX|nr:Gp37 family protein [Pseudomonas azotoformans]RMU57759.1 hypothetical protein ALP29_00224 [Pseudomonas syringae pv. avii]